MTCLALTAGWITYFAHGLGSPFNVDLHARTFESLDNNTHPTKRRDKLKGPNHAKFQKVSLIIKILARMTLRMSTVMKPHSSASLQSIL